MKKFIKNPYAESLRKNGCRITVTSGEGENKKIVEQYFVSPEQIAEENAQRETILRNRRVQN
jgi:hypothetical protein